jgi:preprotein translocase subunit SecD
MTIRHTICTLALIAGAAVSGCNSEKSETPTETTPGTSEAAEQAAVSGFGMHIGSYEQGEGLTETWVTPERSGSRTLYYDPEPFITGEHIAEFADSQDESGNPAVGLRFTDEGAEALRTATIDRIGEPIVFTLESEVLYAPTVQSVLGRVAMVTGSEGDTDWIQRLESILADAGAEKVDRVSQPDQEPDMLPAVGIYRAGTEQTADLNIAFNEVEGLDLWMAAEPMLTEEHIESVTMSRDEAGRPALELTMTEDGAAILDDRVDDYVGRYFVFTWQGRALSAPRVMSELGRKLMITGPALDPRVPDDWMTKLQESLSE